MKHKIRSRILPRAPSDIGAFLFIAILIPSTFLVDLCIVLPSMYRLWSFWYTFHFICASFILINITSNFVAALLIDTSLKGIVLPADRRPGWRFCSVCEAVAPPRSWHCNVCKTCILKRDHHCMFTGCCIGHNNYRYFYMFLLYITIGTMYASYFNAFYIWYNVDLNSALMIFKLVVPMAMLVFGIDSSQIQCILLISLINFVSCLFTSILLYFHTNLLINGVVTYESNHNINKYSYGRIQNIIHSLGKSWYLSWILPFIHSELPHDGVYWVENQRKVN